MAATSYPPESDPIAGPALAAHIADTSDAHDASAISFAPAAGVVATDLQAAVVEVAGDASGASTAVSDHVNDSTAAHAASAVSYSPGGTVAATTVQGAIAEVASETDTRFLAVEKNSLVPTAVKTANATLAANDYAPIDTTAGAVTITLPSAPADGVRVGVKHVIQGGTNAVTVARGGSDVFNKAGGSTSLSLPLLNQSYILQYKASTGVWYAQSGDTPLSQLDARFLALTALDTDGTLAANSDTKVASQKAVKTYVAAHGGGAAQGAGNTGYLSLRNDFGLDPTSAVGALTTAIQSAVNAAVAAGKGIDLGADMWPINAPLNIPGSFSLRAIGAGEVWGTVANSVKTCVPGASPWVKGGGLSQQTAGANILNVLATGPTVHLTDLVLRWADAIAFHNTGHGVYCVPTATYLGLPENGPAGCLWDNIVVFGHDGDHYAFYTVNMNLWTASNLRSYGGGGWFEKVDSAASGYGNGTLIEPYFALVAPGTADGFHMVATNSAGLYPGSLNLVIGVRPQCNIVDVSTFPLGTAYSIASAPSTVNQFMYRDVATNGVYPQSMHLIAVDLEPYQTYSYFFGPGTIQDTPNAFPGGNTVYGYLSLPSDVTGQFNTAMGANALTAKASAATGNTAVGYGALKVSTGASNVAVGYNALLANTTGNANTALGVTALAGNTTGVGNTAVGSSLTANTTGQFNTGVGYGTLGVTTTVSYLTALGYGALAANSSGTLNTAGGAFALTANTTGAQNTALGSNALKTNTTGGQNTAAGWNALTLSTTAGQNTAFGANSLAAKTTGNQCTAVGALAAQAITTGANNTGVGYAALVGVVTGTGNTALGNQAGYFDGTNTTTDNSGMTLLGDQAQSTTSNVIVLGKAVATRPNLIFGGIGAAAAFGGGVGVFAIANAVTVPASNPVGGGVLYVTAGALTYRGSSGTVTTVAPA